MATSLYSPAALSRSSATAPASSSVVVRSSLAPLPARSKGHGHLDIITSPPRRVYSGFFFFWEGGGGGSYRPLGNPQLGLQFCIVRGQRGRGGKEIYFFFLIAGRVNSLALLCLAWPLACLQEALESALALPALPARLPSKPPTRRAPLTLRISSAPSRKR